MTAMATVRLGQLTGPEAARLADLEARIRRGMETFVEVGTALAEVRESRLHRATHATFEDYCRDRWGLTDRRARQLMEAAEIGTMVPVSNERQARAIAPVIKSEGPEAAAEVLRTAAESGPVTAKGITEAASNRAKVTETTRTTEATKVEQVVDLDTGEVLNENVTVEQWRAEGNDPTDPAPSGGELVERMLANDPDVRAANLRHGVSKWLYHLSQYHLYDPAEIAAIAPDLADDIAKMVGHVTEWGDRYAAAHRRARMTVVRGQ